MDDELTESLEISIGRTVMPKRRRSIRLRRKSQGFLLPSCETEADKICRPEGDPEVLNTTDAVGLPKDDNLQGTTYGSIWMDTISPDVSVLAAKRNRRKSRQSFMSDLPVTFVDERPESTCDPNCPELPALNDGFSSIEVSRNGDSDHSPAQGLANSGYRLNNSSRSATGEGQDESLDADGSMRSNQGDADSSLVDEKLSHGPFNSDNSSFLEHLQQSDLSTTSLSPCYEAHNYNVGNKVQWNFENFSELPLLDGTPRRGGCVNSSECPRQLPHNMSDFTTNVTPAGNNCKTKDDVSSVTPIENKICIEALSVDSIPYSPSQPVFKNISPLNCASPNSTLSPVYLTPAAKVMRSKGDTEAVNEEEDDIWKTCKKDIPDTVRYQETPSGVNNQQQIKTTQKKSARKSGLEDVTKPTRQQMSGFLSICRSLAGKLASAVRNGQDSEEDSQMQKLDSVSGSPGEVISGYIVGSKGNNCGQKSCQPGEDSLNMNTQKECLQLQEDAGTMERGSREKMIDSIQVKGISSDLPEKETCTPMSCSPVFQSNNAENISVDNKHKVDSEVLFSPNETKNELTSSESVIKDLDFTKDVQKDREIPNNTGKPILLGTGISTCSFENSNDDQVLHSSCADDILHSEPEVENKLSSHSVTDTSDCFESDILKTKNNKEKNSVSLKRTDRFTNVRKSVTKRKESRKSFGASGNVESSEFINNNPALNVNFHNTINGETSDIVETCHIEKALEGKSEQVIGRQDHKPEFKPVKNYSRVRKTVKSKLLVSDHEVNINLELDNPHGCIQAPVESVCRMKKRGRPRKFIETDEKLEKSQNCHSNEVDLCGKDCLLVNSACEKLEKVCNIEKGPFPDVPVTGEDQSLFTKIQEDSNSVQANTSGNTDLGLSANLEKNTDGIKILSEADLKSLDEYLGIEDPEPLEKQLPRKRGRPRKSVDGGIKSKSKGILSTVSVSDANTVMGEKAIELLSSVESQKPTYESICQEALSTEFEVMDVMERPKRKSSRIQRRSIEIYRQDQTKNLLEDVSLSPQVSEEEEKKQVQSTVLKDVTDNQDKNRKSKVSVSRQPQKRKMGKAEPSLEEIYKNKNFQRPLEKNWATIYETPSEDQLYSKKKYRRSITFDDCAFVPPAKTKTRLRKAIKLGLDLRKRRRQMLSDAVVKKKLANIEAILEDV